MGDATHGDALNVPERIQLDLYSSTFQLMTVTSSQDVTLQVADTMTPGIKGVRVQTSDSAHTLYVERRSGDYVSNGVILWGFPQGALLDLDRATTTDRWMMKVGETYRDGTYVCVTLLAQDAMTATVHVDVPCSSVTPAVRLAPTGFRVVSTILAPLAPTGFRVMAGCQGLFGVRGAESR